MSLYQIGKLRVVVSVCAMVFLSLNAYTEGSAGGQVDVDSKLEVSADSGLSPSSINFSSFGYDSHVELSWNASDVSDFQSIRIFRSSEPDDGFIQVASSFEVSGRNQDFIGTGQTVYYYAETYAQGNTLIERSATISAETRPFSDEELLDMVQEYTFRYFWEYGHPVSGLARERLGSGDVVTTGGSGFGIMAIVVGVHRGFISRSEGLDRILQIVSFLEISNKFYGVFPHWMNGSSGSVIPFSTYDDGADLVETAFLIQGLLTARQFFDSNDTREEGLRLSITSLYENINWNWFRKQTQKVLYWHWSPNHQWRINFPLRGFNETMITYLLAIASPTNSIPANLYQEGWAAGSYTNGASYYGYPLAVGGFRGGPLFFSHYSFLGFDPRGIRDEYCNYFERNRNHTLINRAYCVANPEGHEGYSEDCWGLTASDNPWGYLAHEPTSARDNGTITPTATLSSMPYTPAESLAALRHFYREQGERLWGPYGFYDAFNLDEDWFADSYLAIDQGPIICMLENYRSGLLWEHFMANPEIQPALEAMGFVPDTLTSTSSVFQHEVIPVSIFPNPVDDEITIEVHEATAVSGRILLLDQKGTEMISRELKETTAIKLDRSRIPGGMYFLKVYLGEDYRVFPVQLK